MAASWDFMRGPAGVGIMVAAARDRGMSAEQALAGTGLSAAGLEDPATRVEAGQELQVARNLLARFGDVAGLGADAGARSTVGTFGVLTFAIITSPTVGEALALAVRFWRLSSAFVRLDPVTQDGALRLVIHDEEIPADVRGLLVERDLAAIAAIGATLLGGAAGAHLETTFSGARADAIAAVSPRRVTLVRAASQHALVAGPALLARPLPQADTATRRACELECARLLDARRRRGGTAGRVRARLLEDPSAMPAMSDVARELALDVRALRRHLAAEGTSFRALREEVCSTLAQELLTSAGLTVGEVAARLGYSDASAFTHAFTRWHGRPPSALR